MSSLILGMTSAQGRAGRRFLSKLRGLIGFRAGTHPGVGIDVGSASIKIVEAHQRKSRWIVTQAFVIPRTHDLLEDLKKGFQRVSSPHRAVIGVAGSALVTKVLSVNALDSRDLADQVYWEAEQYIPYDIAEAVVDYSVVGKTQDQKTEVVLVAIKKDALHHLGDPIRKAGFQLDVIEPEVFALAQAFENEAQAQNLKTPGAQLILDFGARSLKQVIIGRGIPLLVKETGQGGRNLMDELAASLGLSAQDAEHLVSSEQVPVEMIDGLKQKLLPYVTEIRRTLEIYAMAQLGPEVQLVALGGGYSKIPGLNLLLEQQLRLRVHDFQPFTGMDIEIPEVDRVNVNKFYHLMGPAVGMAMRGGDFLP